MTNPTFKFLESVELLRVVFSSFSIISNYFETRSRIWPSESRNWLKNKFLDAKEKPHKNLTKRPERVVQQKIGIYLNTCTSHTTLKRTFQFRDLFECEALQKLFNPFWSFDLLHNTFANICAQHSTNTAAGSCASTKKNVNCNRTRFQGWQVFFPVFSLGTLAYPQNVNVCSKKSNEQITPKFRETIF